jgi:hypothetical protein
MASFSTPVNARGNRNTPLLLVCFRFQYRLSGFAGAFLAARATALSSMFKGIRWMSHQAGFSLAFHDHLGEPLFFYQGIVMACRGVIDTDVNHDLCAGIGNPVRLDRWDVDDRAGLPHLCPDFAV